MRTAGIEPAPHTGQDPKSCASASSATFASQDDCTAVVAYCVRQTDWPTDRQTKVQILPLARESLRARVSERNAVILLHLRTSLGTGQNGSDGT